MSVFFLVRGLVTDLVPQRFTTPSTHVTNLFHKCEKTCVGVGTALKWKPTTDARFWLERCLVTDLGTHPFPNPVTPVATPPTRVTSCWHVWNVTKTKRDNLCLLLFSKLSSYRSSSQTMSQLLSHMWQILSQVWKEVCSLWHVTKQETNNLCPCFFW